MVIFVTQDLMLASRAKAHAQAAGSELIISPRLPAVGTLSPDTSRILIDLQSGGTNLSAWVASIREGHAEVQIIGYAPHVQTQLLKQAADAGLDHVLTRGQFDRSMDEWVDPAS